MYSVKAPYREKQELRSNSLLVIFRNRAKKWKRIKKPKLNLPQNLDEMEYNDQYFSISFEEAIHNSKLNRKINFNIFRLWRSRCKQE